MAQMGVPSVGSPEEVKEKTKAAKVKAEIQAKKEKKIREIAKLAEGLPRKMRRQVHKAMWIKHKEDFKGNTRPERREAWRKSWELLKEVN